MAQLKGDLTAAPKTDPSLTFYWYDNQTTKADNLLNEKFIVHNESGPIALTHVSGTIFRASGYFDLLDTVYDDSDDVGVIDLDDGVSFYTSYKNNYQAYTLTSESHDLSMNIVDGVDSIATIEPGYENNDLLFDLSKFGEVADDNHDILTDVHNIELQTNLDYLTVSNVDISNNLTFTFIRAGIPPVTVPDMYIGDTGITLDLNVKALGNGAITFTTDLDTNEANIGIFPYPSVYFARMIDNSSNFVYGTHNVSLPINIPVDTGTLRSGSWNLFMTYTDGDFTEQQQIRVVVMPTFSSPVISVDGNSSVTVLPSIDGTSNDISFNTVFSVNYTTADKANVDIVAWNNYMEVRAILYNYDGETYNEIVTLSDDIMALDVSSNNMSPITEDVDGVEFNLEYSGLNYLLTSDTVYRLRVSWRAHGATAWHDTDYNVDVLQAYDTSPTIANNFDGTYSINSYTLFNDDEFEMTDLSENALVDLSGNDFMAVNGTTYRLVVKTGDNEYPNTEAEFTTYTYAERITATNNYDGTFTLSLPYINNVDELRVISETDSQILVHSDGSATFTPIIGQNYIAQIWTDGGEGEFIPLSVTETESTFGFFYTEALTFEYLHNGTVRIANVPESGWKNGDQPAVVHDGTVTTLSLVDDEYIFTMPVGETCTAVIYNSTDDQYYTHIVSGNFIEYFDEALTITYNYDGTYTIDNVPGTLYGATVQTYYMNEGSKTGFADYVGGSFTPDAGVIYYATIMRDGVEQTHTTSSSVYEHYDTSFNYIDNNDGTFTITDGHSSLKLGDSIVAYDTSNNETTTLSYGGTYTPEVNVVAYFEIQRGGTSLTHTRSGNFTNYFGDALTVTYNFDGTFTVNNVPEELHGYVVKYYYMDGGKTGHTELNEGNSYTFTPTPTVTYYVALFNGTDEQTHTTSSSIVESFNGALDVINNYDGSYSTSNLTLAVGDVIKVIDVSSNTVIEDYDTSYSPDKNVEIRFEVHRDGTPLTNTRSETFVEYYDTSFIIDDNFDGTFTISNENDVGLNTVDVSDVVIMSDVSGFLTTQLSLVDGSFTPEMNANLYTGLDYFISIYRDGNELTHTRSNIITKSYEEQLIIAHDYDNVYYVSNSNILRSGDKIVVLLGDDPVAPGNIQDLVDNSYSPTNAVDKFRFAVSGYDGSEWQVYVQTVSANGRSFGTTQIELRNNLDGTYDAINWPMNTFGATGVYYHNVTDDVYTYRTGSLIPESGKEYRAVVRDTDANRNYTLLTSESIVELIGDSFNIEIINRWNGYYDITHDTVPSGYKLMYQSASTDTSFNIVGWDGYTTTNQDWFIQMETPDGERLEYVKSETIDMNSYRRQYYYIGGDTLGGDASISTSVISYTLNADTDGVTTSETITNAVNTYTNFTVDSNTVAGDYGTTYIATFGTRSPTWFTDISNNVSTTIYIVDVPSGSEKSQVLHDANILSLSNDVLYNISGPVYSETYERYITSYTAPNLAKTNASFKLKLNLKENRSSASTVMAIVVQTYTPSGGDPIILTGDSFYMYFKPDSSEFVGGRYSNLIVYNDSILDIMDVNAAGVIEHVSDEFGNSLYGDTITDVSTNTFSNLTTSAGSTLYINGGNAQLTYGAFSDIDRVHNVVSGFVEWSSSGNGTVTSSSEGRFSLNKFTGHIDVLYHIEFDGIRTENKNGLRIIVLPRPVLTYNLRDVTLNNLDANRAGYLVHEALNQQYDSGFEVNLSLSDMTPLSDEGVAISSGVATFTGFRTLWTNAIRLTWSLRTMDPDSELFEHYNSSSFIDDNSVVLPYGTTIDGHLKFLGKDIDGSDPADHQITYTGTIYFTHPSSLSPSSLSYRTVSSYDTAIFTFVDDDDTLPESRYDVNNLHVTDGTYLNNVEVTKYIKTNVPVNLISPAPDYVYVIVENIKLQAITVTYDSGSTLSLPFANRAVFLRKSSTAWTHLYTTDGSVGEVVP